MWVEHSTFSVPGAAALTKSAQRANIQDWVKQEGIRGRVRERQGWWSCRCVEHQDCPFHWKHEFHEDRHVVYVQESLRHSQQTLSSRGYTAAQREAAASYSHLMPRQAVAEAISDGRDPQDLPPIGLLRRKRQTDADAHRRGSCGLGAALMQDWRAWPSQPCPIAGLFGWTLKEVDPVNHKGVVIVFCPAFVEAAQIIIASRCC